MFTMKMIEGWEKEKETAYSFLRLRLMDRRLPSWKWLKARGDGRSCWEEMHTGVECPGSMCGVGMGLDTLTPPGMGDARGLDRALCLMMPFFVRTVEMNKNYYIYIFINKMSTKTNTTFLTVKWSITKSTKTFKMYQFLPNPTWNVPHCMTSILIFGEEG